MRHSIAEFTYEIKRDMNNVKEVLRRTASHAMDAAIVKVVNQSKIWSGSFIASNRIGVGSEDTTPPTNMKVYIDDDGVVIQELTEGARVSAIKFGDNHVFLGVTKSNGRVSSGYPAKLIGPAQVALRGKMLSELLGKLMANKNKISAFGAIYLTNDATDPKTGDYALAADHLSKSVYKQARRVANEKAQEEFNKVIKLDKVAHL